MTTRTSASYRLTLTVGLCFLVALMEGLDLQAAGIAAVGIAHAFALDKMQMGWIFSAGILGLLPGALVGGFLIGLCETFIKGSAYSEFSDVFTFVVLILVLLVRPTGLFGEKLKEKVGA